MKTRINLYLDEFKPKTQPVSLGQTVLLWVLLLVVLVSMTWLNSLETKSLDQQTLLVRENLANEQGIQKELQVQVAKRRIDPDLELQVEQLSADLALKQELSKRLSGNSFANGGFSELMQELADIDEPQLWLNAIDIRGQALQLRGLTLSADIVPRWIGRFSQHPSLGNKSFHSMLIERDQEQTDLLHFQLSSELELDELNVAPTFEELN
ncbi:hypothetical protein DBZ36_01645 [Alginatibacterium sediminis]|uniref:MSHA biogenesis protein MshI n=1 Tax=Alginatibacterium sediminis TaxID=2164068 RepID=A0A420EKY3_9ALTE|nr:PilN domain-containing protein [Alginatibacterium sediminis]RKF21381.1 hypothetical protein DBZ36_01645 [Alginatibacterium sediminis]